MTFLVWSYRVALAYAPALLYEVLGGSHDGRRREWAKVACAIVAHDATACEAWPFGRSIGAQGEIALVVAHQNVEARLVLLDQRSLGEKRLRLVLDGHRLEVVHGVNHRAHFRRMPRTGPEVRRYSAPEVFRLAYIDYYAPTISHEIAAGAIREFL